MKVAGFVSGFRAAPWLAAVAVGLLISLAAADCRAEGRDGGDFEGAVWRFEMTPKGSRGGGAPLAGRYRVAKHVLYQKRDRQDKDFSKRVGTNRPSGKRTKVEFDGLRAADKDGAFREGIGGTALLTMDRFGEWSGTLVDGDGRHWDFRCTRVKE